MNKISNAFHEKATGKNVIIALVTLVLFLGISMPLLNIFLPQYMDLPLLENPTIYSHTEIFDIVKNWGHDGRIWQIVFHLTWDIVLPVLIIMFFALTISWHTKRCFDENNKMQKLNLIALLYSFDLLENVTIEVLVISYPAKFKIVALLKNIFTVCKYSIGALLFLVIIILFIRLFIIKGISRKK